MFDRVLCLKMEFTLCRGFQQSVFRVLILRSTESSELDFIKYTSRSHATRKELDRAHTGHVGRGSVWHFRFGKSPLCGTELYMGVAFISCYGV